MLTHFIVLVVKCSSVFSSRRDLPLTIDPRLQICCKVTCTIHVRGRAGVILQWKRSRTVSMTTVHILQQGLLWFTDCFMHSGELTRPVAVEAGLSGSIKPPWLKSAMGRNYCYLLCSMNSLTLLHPILSMSQFMIS